MAPVAVDTPVVSEVYQVTNGVKKSTSGLIREPLKYSGSLDEYDSFDVTNTIGKEFPNVQISDILKDDRKIRDLAILVSERGVVFFRDQDLKIEEQKILGQKLGELTGKPATSKFHRHPLHNSRRGLAVDEHGKVDDDVSVLDSNQMRKHYDESGRYAPKSKLLASEGWHADITFERVPADYSILKLTKLPEDVGGDTLWASGYEAYERLSPVFQKLAETLTATHHQAEFRRTSEKYGIELLDHDRGSPENYGLDFAAVHPVIRTNPVTGWKSLFGVGLQVRDGWINDVQPRESEMLKRYFLDTIAQNHDLQVRFRWNKNDLAIWDNRSVLHTWTNDYVGSRQGNRVVSIGEKPYYDPNSLSRREALHNAMNLRK